jgi:hypothetical protein
MKKIEEFVVLKHENEYLRVAKENGWEVIRGTKDILKADRFSTANSAAYHVGGHALAYTPIRIRIEIETKVTELKTEKFGTREEIWGD